MLNREKTINVNINKEKSLCELNFKKAFDIITEDYEFEYLPKYSQIKNFFVWGDPNTEIEITENFYIIYKGKLKDLIFLQSWHNHHMPKQKFFMFKQRHHSKELRLRTNGNITVYYSE